MFNQLTRLWFGDQQQHQQPQQQHQDQDDEVLVVNGSSAAATGVESSFMNLTSTEVEDDEEWILVDRHHPDGDGVDSEGNSECSWSSGEDETTNHDDSEDRIVVVPLLRRSSSSSSLATSPNNNNNNRMEESWFLTPPPCFISTGPVHMETSPFENLLIEHPSMSVYTHHGRRQHLLAPVAVLSRDEQVDEHVEVEEDDDEVVVVRRTTPALSHNHRNNNRGQVMQQQERQGLKNKQAQKVQIKKSCKVFNRGQLDRTNKAREVNSRNRRQRRGERSQGAQRSHANNNRKCC